MVAHPQIFNFGKNWATFLIARTFNKTKQCMHINARTCTHCHAHFTMPTCKYSNKMSRRDSIYMQMRKQTKLQALKQVQTGRTYIGSKHRGPKAGERHNVICSTKGQGEGFKFIPSQLTC